MLLNGLSALLEGVKTAVHDADEEVLGGLSCLGLVVNDIDTVDENELNLVSLALVGLLQLVEMLGYLFLEIADLLVLLLDDLISLIEHVC